MDEAIEVLEREPPSRELARIYARKTGELLLERPQRRVPGVGGEDARAGDPARPAGRDTRGRCSSVARLDASWATNEAWTTCGRRSGSGRRAGSGRCSRSRAPTTRSSCGSGTDRRAALEVWRDAQRAAETRGFAGLAQMARMGQLETLFDLGRWDEVLAISREIQAWIQPARRADRAGACTPSIFESWVRLRRGETEGLAEVADALLEFAASVRRRVRRARGAPGRRDASRGRRRRGRARGDRQRSPSSRRSRRTSGRCSRRSRRARWSRSGDVDLAERLIPDHSDARTKRHRVSLMTARAVVAEARGLTSDALAGIQAVDQPSGVRTASSSELGLTLIGAARCLLELDRRDEAADALVEARDVLRPLRAAPRSPRSPTCSAATSSGELGSTSA